MNEQLTREPKQFPTLSIDPSIRDIDSIKPEHFKLEGYDPHPTLKADLTVAGGFNEDDRIDFTKKTK